ncbi:MAG: hypothetical protein CL916_04740 [Deltaproteobacteria bacterium]|nr:hypothetical protein [Deltaproteobacteria bacterium]
MIISIIIYISCLSLNSSSTRTHVFHDTRLFSTDSVDSNSTLTKNLQERSQAHFLLGVQSYQLKDHILARSYGIQCLDDITRFSIMQVEKTPIFWSNIPVRTKGTCDEETPSVLLSISSNSVSVACMTWTIGSWSHLLQEYRIESGVMNAKSLLVMATWLEEHRKCLDSPWVRFAIATGLLYGFDSTENKSRFEEREEYALSLIESLWDHPELQYFVRFWYIRHRVHNTAISKQEIAIWITALKGEHIESKIPQVKQLLKMLRDRQIEKR